MSVTTVINAILIAIRTERDDKFVILDKLNNQTGRYRYLEQVYEIRVTGNMNSSCRDNTLLL